MSLATPTTQDISDTIVAQVESSLNQTIPLIPKAFTRVLAKAFAGVVVLLYKYAGFIFLQLFVAYASMEETTINGKRIRPLVEWGRLIGEGDPGLAQRAEIMIAVTVTNQVGSLAARSELLFADSGVMYQVVADTLLNAPTVQVKVKASSDQNGGDGAGTIGNRQPGDIVSFANPQRNVATDTTVISTAVLGVEAESPDSYRARIIKRFQRKPQGGAYADYQQWGEEPEGIFNVYPYAGQPGEVDVYVEVAADLGNPDGLPSDAQLDVVKSAIELDVSGLASRRQTNCLVNVLPIRRAAFNVLLSGLDPDTPESRTAIEQALDEHFRSREPFIVGLSVLPRTDRITQAGAAGVVDTIVNAQGGSVASVKLREGLVPVEARSLRNGEKTKLGTTTYHT